MGLGGDRGRGRFCKACREPAGRFFWGRTTRAQAPAGTGAGPAWRGASRQAGWISWSRIPAPQTSRPAGGPGHKSSAYAGSHASSPGAGKTLASWSVRRRHGEQVRQHADHGQHNQCLRMTLMQRCLLEVTIARQRLKHRGLNPPAAAADLMNETRRDGAQLDVGGAKVGAFFLHGLLDGLAAALLLDNREAPPGPAALGFDHTHRALRRGPLHGGLMPQPELLVAVVLVQGENVFPVVRRGAGFFRGRSKAGSTTTPARCIRD